ncbi:universal stress protein [Microbulbifer yueqingensis]|uniref:Nucleotide-binding universal stress protein, UspA family n=1 Tax=Microbulbifer yueqingensis TaxID=658219 RepID=A0A1G9E1G4_9GAMM|nr:universal stress protein [Microbulbifer yueqingensis]SDK69920.1 Nucleotide-binding universal stress protein, UspA family [Microbulbifer yueqingensis]
MQNIHKVMFVSHAIEDENDGLQQAVSLAHTSGAELRIVAVCPALPEDFEDYSDAYGEGLTGRVESSLDAVRKEQGLSAEDLPASIEVECGSAPANRVIRRVMEEDFDMVIKNVEGRSRRKGFKAMDMELLRKCPCPVWLCRPLHHGRDDIRVLVAVDPECEEGHAYDLAIRLLRLSRALADSWDGTLHIVSCWDYDVDAYLRHNFPLDLPDEEIDRIVEQAGAKHRAKLDVLIRAAGIGGAMEIHHTIANPARFIPLLVEEKEFDLLVMGTVARTGIPGFIMGNTAENILQKLGCSLLALKPASFESPVKAD